MTTLRAEIQVSSAERVSVTEEMLTVDLNDGRVISVPLSWYPRLVQGTPEERAHWRLIGHGEGIHWPDLDEDISVENLVCGHPSGESQSSLQRWLENRAR
ncbi:MAG TPA: DUF2442 domain-containing protein [Thermoanaerobaculia bacterium]|nr:DUF2442 domain-containing protein [Thermoanaerobaculia bacterium]